MNLEEFERELRTNSAVKDPIERKWDLHELACRLGIIGYSRMTKSQLIDNILTIETRKRLMTREEIKKEENEDPEFQIICEIPVFQPYTIKIYIGSREVHDNLIKDIKRLQEELCHDADWIIEPLKKAIGI